MPKDRLVKKKHLEAILADLWSKAKKKFVEDITFNKGVDAQGYPKNTLTVTKDGQSQEVVPHIVTEWNDLPHVKKVEFENILNFSARKDGEWYGNTGTTDVPLQASANHSVVYVPVERGVVYTILKRKDDGVKRVFFLENDNTINGGNTPYTQIANGWFKATATEADARLKHLAIQFDNTQITARDIMVFKNNVEPTHAQYVPYGAESDKIVIGTEVEHEFDPKNSGLKSNTVDDAIRELDKKIGASTAGVSDIKYNPETRTITMTKDGRDVAVTEDLTDLASQGKHPNEFTTKSGFTNGYIKGKGTNYTLVNAFANQTIQDAIGRDPNNTKCWWTSSLLKIEKNTPVTTLRVAVGGTIQENNVINDILIRAAEITRTGGADQNFFTAREDLFKGKAIVKRVDDAEIGNQLYVDIPINKRFDREIVLMIQVPYSLVGRNTASGHIGISGTQEMHQTGTEFVVAGNTQPYGIMKVVSQDIPFEELINKDRPIFIEDVHNLDATLKNKIDVSEKADITKDTGAHNAGKVVVLDENGMIHKSMYEFTDEMINEVEVDADKDHTSYTVGDTIYAKDTKKRYLILDTRMERGEELELACLDDMLDKHRVVQNLAEAEQNKKEYSNGDTIRINTTDEIYLIVDIAKSLETVGQGIVKLNPITQGITNAGVLKVNELEGNITLTFKEEQDDKLKLEISNGADAAKTLEIGYYPEQDATTLINKMDTLL